MEFKFDLKPFFKTNIIRINSNLIPQGFVADRRTILDTTTKISEIINEVGEASARAQGLNKAVTTALKLRNSDHIIYLMGDKSGDTVSVTGFLKIGTKSLYVFNEHGDSVQVMAPCILDFYIHESKQRTGLGKELFQTMLERENINPVKLAIDRPSEKLVAFLRKHYGLIRTIPQMNNFVIYEGFFNKKVHDQQYQNNETERRNMQITSSPNTALFGPHFITDDINKKCNRSQQPSPTLPSFQNAPIGRFGAPRPTCSMAEIIHSSPTSIADEPNSLQHIEYTIENQVVHHGNHHDGITNNVDYVIDPNEDHTNSTNDDIETQKITENINNLNITPDHNQKTLNIINDNNSIIVTHQKPVYFQHSKQHTGLKNLSFNVGAAVSPTDKMEFVQETPESFGIVKINQPIATTPVALSPIIQSHHFGESESHGNDIPPTEGLTDQGYFDLKFYHNKLW